VATDVGAASLIVKDGVNGHLVKPGNIDEMVSSLEDLLRNPSLMGPMGRKSREIVESQFTLDRVARRFIGLFEKS
jgi:glycosyltransferase involved in cell wall biosynthesis